MLEQIRRVRQEESGFTLIELLIVIVVLGVLSTIVVMAVGGINDQSKTAACKSDVKTVTVASEAYYAEKGTYTNQVPDLVNAGLLHAAPTTPVTITVSGSGAAVSATCGGSTYTG